MIVIEETPLCQAGQLADYGGRWTIPCIKPATHCLGFTVGTGGPADPDTPLVYLCDEHADELIEAGMIEEPDVGRDEFLRRQREAGR